MTKKTQELFQEALLLPMEELELLVTRLVATLDSKAKVESSDDFVAELRRRIDNTLNSDPDPEQTLEKVAGRLKRKHFSK